MTAGTCIAAAPTFSIARTLPHTGLPLAELPVAELFNAADTRADMAATHPDLVAFTTDIHLPASTAKQQADVELVEL